MAEPVTISFVGDTEIEAVLKEWAANEDRSVSAVIRLIILAERARRAPQLPLAIDETQEESTTEQMNRAGCGRLVEA